MGELTLEEAMKPFFAVGVLALTGLAIHDGRGQDTKDNVPRPGFKALFNGKDLTNWQGLVPINRRAKLTPDELARRKKGRPIDRRPLDRQGRSDPLRW